MTRTLIAITLGCALSSLAHAEWFFRGTANAWGSTQMDFVGGNEYRTCQTFSAGDTGGGPRFKIDRFADWAESFPGADRLVDADKSYQIAFFSDSKTIRITEVNSCAAATASWLFRGTPNAWGSTAMDRLDGTNFCTDQTFANGDANGGPRFRIDHFGDWIEAFPGSDVAVAVNSSQHICFNANSKAITVTANGTGSVPDIWYFRGTPNAWDATEMTSGDGVNFCLNQHFANGDAGGGPRFKIDHFVDWTQSFPIGDFAVAANSDQHICFNAETHAISVAQDAGATTPTPDAWFFRGTPNAWGKTPMESTDGVNFCLLQAFAEGDAGGGARFRIDHFGDWIDSFPATDFSVAANSEQSICFNAATMGLDVTQTSGSAPPPVTAGDFRGETIYFLLTARFYDGDPGNNYFNRDRIKAGDPQWRGDFKGLIAKLDYIKDLGFTAIWVTPPVENRSGLDYHGYHAYDWAKVDHRLESPGATYQDFINAAHAKGLKVIQDVVINHSSQYGIRGKVWIDHLPIKYFVPQGSSQGQINNPPYLGNLGDYLSANRDDNDNPVAPAWFRERHNSDPSGTVPLVDPKTGVTVPLAGYDANRFFGIEPFGLDPVWYHLDGFMAGGDWESPVPLVNKSIAGDAIDLNTGSQTVKDYLNAAIESYLDMGVDAIRLDTAKHVERGELLSYTQHWQTHKPGTFVFGEVFVLGAGFGNELSGDNASAVIRPWWYTRTGNDPRNPQGDSGFSVLDFPLFSTFRDNVTRGSFSGIGGMLGMDWTYADPTQLVTFFQNHDGGPDNDFKFRYGGVQQNAALAYNLLWTIRGIPTLYYGEEVQFQAGKPEDIKEANDTLDQTGRAYYGAVLDDPNTPNHPLYRHIQRLNQIRRAIPALQSGRMEQVSEWGSGMRFVRHDGNAWAVVGLAAGSTQTISVGGLPNGTWRDAVTGAVVSVGNGNLSFSVKPYSAGIYVLNGPGKIGVDGTWLK